MKSEEPSGNLGIVIFEAMIFCLGVYLRIFLLNDVICAEDGPDLYRPDLLNIQEPAWPSQISEPELVNYPKLVRWCDLS